MKFPLVTGGEDELLLERIAIPELHLLLGIVNKITEELNTKLGGNTLYEWLYQKSVVRSNYHGNCMEGPQCNKLLKLVNDLRDFLPPDLKVFAECL